MNENKFGIVKEPLKPKSNAVKLVDGKVVDNLDEEKIMSKKLAIKGHSTRGNEVIELLEMMGGVNADSHNGNFPDVWESSYYIYGDNTIQFGKNEFLLKLNFVIFTLEEFLRKYPYKVGDKVYTKSNAEGTIIDMCWDGIEVLYQLSSESVNALGYFRANELKTYKEEVINTQPYITAKVTDKNHKMGPKSKLPSKYYEDRLEEIKSKREYDDLRMSLDDDDKLATEATIMGKKILPPDGYLVGKITQTDNGMLVEYVEKKTKYPSTYAECCEVLVGRKPKPNEISFDKMELCLVDLNNSQNIDFQNPYLSQLNSLFRLRMCRDAYWKIYGEETGLGKPWKPDWNDEIQKYCIRMDRNKIVNCSSSFNNRILAFPTEEMRDVFHENFKDLIEQCKELL